MEKGALISVVEQASRRKLTRGFGIVTGASGVLVRVEDEEEL